MDTVQAIPKSGGTSWGQILTNLLPLWMLSLAILVEGFPRPPLPKELAILLFFSSIPIIILLAVKKWMTIGLFLYSLFPIVLAMMFDEISTVYKTPAILLAALLLTIGGIVYQRSTNLSGRWLILLLAAGVTFAFASKAAGNYWSMVGELHLGDECFPDLDCPIPFPWETHPWWSILFRL